MKIRLWYESPRGVAICAAAALFLAASPVFAQCSRGGGAGGIGSAALVGAGGGGGGGANSLTSGASAGLASAFVAQYAMQQQMLQRQMMQQQAQMMAMRQMEMAQANNRRAQLVARNQADNSDSTLSPRERRAEQIRQRAEQRREQILAARNRKGAGTQN